MDFTEIGANTSRAELLGPEVNLTPPAQVAGNVADLTRASGMATRANVRTYSASEYRPDGSVKRLTLWVSRDGRNYANALESAAAVAWAGPEVQASRPRSAGERTTHSDLHEVVRDRWASGELVRGRERGARQYLRRSASEFARVHHREAVDTARGIVRGVLGGVALWAVAFALGFVLFALLGCAAVPAPHEELDDLVRTLAATDGTEDALAALAGDGR